MPEKRSKPYKGGRYDRVQARVNGDLKRELLAEFKKRKWGFSDWLNETMRLQLEELKNQK